MGQIDVVGFNTPMTSQVTQVQEEITGLVPTDSSGVFKRVIIDKIPHHLEPRVKDVEKQYETLRRQTEQVRFDKDSSGGSTKQLTSR